jgi:uncharacterized protein
MKLFTVKRSKIHNNGVFASANIIKGTAILEYVGEKVTKKVGDSRADAQFFKGGKRDGHVYLFSLNSRYDIDGNVSWNPAKWLNHSCDPNCDTYVDKGKIWIESVRAIKKGEELTYNYGFSWDERYDHPCLCGSSNCVGFIVSKRNMWRLRKKNAQ